MKALYFETITLVERLHHLFLDVVKAELDRLRIFDINNIQCFILYNVGKNEMTVGEISNRGYYLGTNVSYNLKKLVENGYFIQEQAKHDKRASKIRLSDKGGKLYDGMDASIRSLLSAAYSRVTLSGHKGFYKTIKKGHPYHDRL